MSGYSAWHRNVKSKVEGRNRRFGRPTSDWSLSSEGSGRYIKYVATNKTTFIRHPIAVVDMQTGDVFATNTSGVKGRLLGNVHNPHSGAHDTPSYGRMIIRTLYPNRNGDNGRNSAEPNGSEEGES